MTKSSTKPLNSPTTAQSLDALLKSARDIMRKDKGLNGDLDRPPMLTWIMFLKFLDDLEFQGKDEAKLAGKKFKPAIEPPYRWRDWAAQSDGIKVRGQMEALKRLQAESAAELDALLPSILDKAFKGEL